MNILALDVGPSHVKAAVLDVASANPSGQIARAAFPVEHPAPESAEVAAARLWEAVAAAARAAVVASGVSGRAESEVQGVGFCCFPASLVLLGKDDQPLTPIWLPSDRRARPAARQIWSAAGADFLAFAGSRPAPAAVSIASYRQLLAQDPYLLHLVRRYLHVGGWLGFHMTGAAAMDFENASSSGLFGTLTDRQWSPYWCDRFEVGLDWLPAVVPGSTTLGPLRAVVAAELAVPAGIPVKVGAGTMSSVLHGTGMRRGDLWHDMADLQTLAALADDSRAAERCLTRLNAGGKGYFRVGYHPVGGAALEWLHRLCFRDQGWDEFLARTVPQALSRSTRVKLDPAYLGEDPVGIEARRAAFRDLEPATDRLDLLAALAQTMARGQREALADLGFEGAPRRTFVSGPRSQAIRRLIGDDGDMEIMEYASLQGVANLFR